MSTGATRSGEIYQNRFCFAEPSGSRLRYRCKIGTGSTPLKMTINWGIFMRRLIAIIHIDFYTVNYPSG